MEKSKTRLHFFIIKIKRDLKVVYKFLTDSDHRKVRARVVPNLKLQIKRVRTQTKSGFNINNIRENAEKIEKS